MIDMTKRVDDAFDSLSKAGDAAAANGTPVGDVEFQIKLVFDHSLSMEFPENQFFTKGEVQELAEAILALAMTGLDADRNVQVYPFDSEAYEPFTVTEDNYVGCIDRWRKTPLPRTRQLPAMGGTNYLAVIEKIVSDARANGELEPGQPPILVFFQTDGKTSYEREVMAKLTEYANLPIFWMFQGLGRNTSFLSILNKLEGRVVDNVGFFGTASFREMVAAGTFYDANLEEPIVEWLPAVRAAGIIKV
jgi:hypothetical protein